MTMRKLAAGSLLLACAGIASAQTQVYRCGPNGREYSQQPCPGGSTFDAADPRDAAQRAQARQVADGEKARANRLERERLAREAAVPSRAVALDAGRAAPTAAAASKPSPMKRRKALKPPAAASDFTAVDPKTTRQR
ncbi:MAG: hypothetical protein ABIO45_10475 [Burkholderiaceae bacterium]